MSVIMKGRSGDNTDVNYILCAKMKMPQQCTLLIRCLVACRRSIDFSVTKEVRPLIISLGKVPKCFTDLNLHSHTKSLPKG